MEHIERKKTACVEIGNVTIGGSFPIAVQSMTNTPTEDTDRTVKQITDLSDAGCEIVRVAVPHKKALEALPVILEKSPVPVIADIHFRVDLALGAIDAGVAKIRINPGNLKQKDFLKVTEAASVAEIPMRIGVNSGSVPADLLDKFGGPVPEAMVEAASRYVRRAEKQGFNRIVLSLKSSSAVSTVRACRLAADMFEYPLHIGITEAGDVFYGEIKSAAGLGGLLLDGIGDTVRISLSGDPVREVEAAYRLLKATGRRVLTPEIISCPTCGRTGIDVEKLVSEVKEQIGDLKAPIRIAICGCVVNGPGEAREADLGIAGGGGKGVLFRAGKIIKRLPESQLVTELVSEARALADRKGSNNCRTPDLSGN